MSGKYHRLLLILSVILISFIIVPGGSADSSSDTKDYVKRVNDLNYPAMYSDYPELRTIQSQTISSLQGRNIIDKETKDYVDIIIKIINSFNEIHSLSRSDNPDNHENAVIKAESIRSDIESLEMYKEPREKYYPLLTKISLRKFFKNEAQYFSKKATDERNTNNRIKYELNSARAYKNIGDPKYAELSYRAEEERAKYEYDLTLIKASIKDSNEFLNYANSIANNGFFSSIELFGQGFQLEDSVTNAIQLSNYHEEILLKNQGEDLLKKIKIIKNEAAVSVIKYIIIITAIYLIICLYISWSITRWRNEIYNVDLGNDLLGGIMLE